VKQFAVSRDFKVCASAWVKEMADQSQFEQLDQIVDAILVRRAAAIPDDNAELASLVRGPWLPLRGLPAKNFRVQLKTDLERRINMASGSG